MFSPAFFVDPFSGGGGAFPLFQCGGPEGAWAAAPRGAGPFVFVTPGGATRPVQRSQQQHQRCRTPDYFPRARHPAWPEDAVFADDDDDAEDDGSDNDDGYSRSYGSQEQQQPPCTPQRSAAPKPSASRASSRGANLWGVPPHAWAPAAEWATPFAPASQQWLRQQQQQQQQQPHQHQQQHRHKPSRQQQQQGQQPAFFAAAAAPAAAAAVAPSHGAVPRHIPVRAAAAAAPAAAHSERQQVPLMAAAPAPAAVPAAPAVRPLRRQLSEAEAATIIQRCWRGRRLAQQHAALTALGAASRQLRQLAGKLASAGGVLSHTQYLELNELAMRVLLQLDSTPCGPAEELRAVRKRLAKEAVALLDRAQQAFNATVTASMELPDSVVQQALRGKEQQQDQEELEATAGAGGSEAATEPPAVVVRLVCAGQMCEAATQTD